MSPIRVEQAQGKDGAAEFVALHDRVYAARGVRWQSSPLHLPMLRGLTPATHDREMRPFVARENGPERLVTEAEIHFEEGPLAGTRLVGFSLWRSAEGEIYVTFPSRAFGAGTERRYFDYLRAIDSDPETVKRVKMSDVPAGGRGGRLKGARGGAGSPVRVCEARREAASALRTGSRD